MRIVIYIFSTFVMMLLAINSDAQTTDERIAVNKMQHETALDVDYIKLTDGNYQLANILVSAEENCIKEYGFDKAKKYWPRVVKTVSEPGLQELSGMILGMFNRCMGENMIKLSSLDAEQHPYLHSKGKLAESEAFLEVAEAFLEVAKVLAGE